ncbi:hypothetical protein JYK18_11685 [Amycolatopsis sp. 195334CR]|nr:hypothetical protein [Amycolatopsis sp. 195334CR]
MRWFRDEDELRGRVDLVDAATRPGEMGGEIEALSVVLGSGVLTQLVTSLFGWLEHRRGAQRVRLVVKRPDSGEELELECGSPDDAAEVLATAKKFLEDGR